MTTNSLTSKSLITHDFTLSRDSFGRLNLTGADGVLHENVAPVRAFPIQAPEAGISLVSTDGKEIAWIDSLDQLPAANAALVREELQGREFMPRNRAHPVGDRATPRRAPGRWKPTAAAPASCCAAEEDIRRIGSDTLLISDNHGIHFLIRNQYELDKHSRKILDRFL